MEIAGLVIGIVGRDEDGTAIAVRHDVPDVGPGELVARHRREGVLELELPGHSSLVAPDGE